MAFKNQNIRFTLRVNFSLLLFILSALFTSPISTLAMGSNTTLPNFTDFSIFKKRRFGWPHAPHGRSSLSSGLTREIREAVRFHIEGLKEDDLTIPSPTVITDHATAIANRKKLLDMASTSKK